MGNSAVVRTVSFNDVALSAAWIDGDPRARWRSAEGHRGSASGSSLLEVAEGCRLPRHTDSAEETIVVICGVAEVEMDGSSERIGAGGAALVPAEVLHEVRNAGSGLLRFVALYAADEVVTTYEQPVQPDGGRRRQAVGA